MEFDGDGRLNGYGIAENELQAIVESGLPFRTSGCPGKEAADVSACDRPYGDSPVSDIASYPFALNKSDIRKVKRQLLRDS
ncbi:MAG: hypothetical protein HOA58_13605 [Rhodospirillaceae bacterium]|nr:hypothetical protein [Rhodospirillaceae bacterium]